MLMLMFVVNLCQKADQAHQEDRCWSPWHERTPVREGDQRRKAQKMATIRISIATLGPAAVGRART